MKEHSENEMKITQSNSDEYIMEPEVDIDDTINIQNENDDFFEKYKY